MQNHNDITTKTRLAHVKRKIKKKKKTEHDERNVLPQAKLVLPQDFLVLPQENFFFQFREQIDPKF